MDSSSWPEDGDELTTAGDELVKECERKERLSQLPEVELEDTSDRVDVTTLQHLQQWVVTWVKKHSIYTGPATLSAQNAPDIVSERPVRTSTVPTSHTAIATWKQLVR